MLIIFFVFSKALMTKQALEPLRLGDLEAICCQNLVCSNFIFILRFVYLSASLPVYLFLI